MAEDSPAPDAGLTPETAFAILGDETRLEILRTLGRAEGALAFNELRGRVGYESAGNFSYHLDQLRGHFIRQTERGYQLRRPGERIVEAVLSGAVTESPTVERRTVNRSCPYCDGPVEMAYRQERLVAYCSECDGVYSGTEGADPGAPGTESGLLGHLPLPPAGIQHRSMAEAEAAAWTWGFRDMVALSNGVCPRCSGRLDQAAECCPDHRSGGGLCETCGNRHAVQIRSRCDTCIFAHEGAFVLKLLTNTQLLAFITAHDLNPVLDNWEFGWRYDESVTATDPFEARFTFDIEGDRLTLTVDEELDVTAVSRA